MHSTEGAPSASEGNERGGRLTTRLVPLGLVVGVLLLASVIGPLVAQSWRDEARDRLHLVGARPPFQRTPPTTPPTPPPYDSCTIGRTQAREPLRNDDLHPLGVSLSNGEFQLQVTDLVIPGRGLDLALTRSYRSQSNRFGALGRGWSLSLLDDRLIRRDQGCYPNTMFWERSDGGYVIYPWRSPYIADGGVGKIRRAYPTRAELRMPDGTVMVFTGSFGAGALNGGVLTRIARIGASPIEITWDLNAAPCDPAHPAVPKPIKATLWSCDDDPITNPVGAADCLDYATKWELGRVEFDAYWVNGVWMVKSATVFQTTDSGLHTRKIDYDYEADGTAQSLTDWCESCSRQGDDDRSACGVGCDAGCEPWKTKLQAVHIQALSPDQSPDETVASYSYFDQNGDATTDYLQDNLKEVKDAADAKVMSLTYHESPDRWTESRDTVATISTPAADGGLNRVTTFDYTAAAADPNQPTSPWPRIGKTTVASGGRTTKHWFDRDGHVTRIKRPDDAQMDYAYDATLGRMTQATGPCRTSDPETDACPSGSRVRKWAYSGVVEHPVKYGVIPATTNHGETEQWTCYDVEPVTNAIWRTYLGDDENDCTLDPKNPNATLPANGTQTTLGWMKAGLYNGGPLKTHLVSWGFTIADLPFKGGSGDAPGWPWWSAVEERGRTAATVLDNNGTLASGSQQPVTTYTYAGSQGVLTTITHLDGSQAQFQEQFAYLAPQALGPGPGASTNLGRLAQRTVLDADGTTVRALTQYVYDKWGNTAEERRKVANGVDHWLVQHREYDYRNRLKWEERSGWDNGRSRAEYCYDPDGRVVQKIVDKTTDPTAGTRQYALLQYEYNAAGLVTKEEADESATETGAVTGDECYQGAKRWSGSGASTDRRLAYDQFGNVSQEAVRLESARWRITRTSYNELDRPVEVDAYADPFQGADPPALSATPTGPVAVRRLWYTPEGNVDWEQETGENSDDATVRARLVHREYDGHERLMKEHLCGGQWTASSSSRPSWTTYLNTTEVCWDREDRLTKKIVSDDTASALAAWEKTDYDDRGRPISVRQAKTIGSFTDGGCTATTEPSSVLESRTGYDAQDRVIRTAAPRVGGGFAVTRTEYDALGRRAKVYLDGLPTNSTFANQRLELDRNLLGLVTAQRLVERAGVQDTGTTWTTTFGWDGLGRPTDVTLQDENGDPNRHVKRTFDARDQLTAQCTPLHGTGDCKPEVGTSSGANAHKTWFKYDGLGRKVEEHRHIAEQDTYTNDWQDVRYEFDDGGRLKAVEVEPDGSAPRTVNQKTSFEYDAQGRRTKRTTPDGRDEDSTFDAAGRLWTTTVYSQADQQGTKKSVVRTSYYDEASRRWKLEADTSHADASHYSGTTQQIWTYDGLGRVTQTTDNNGDASNNGVTVVYEFDALSRVIHEKWKATAHADWSVDSTYDDAGRRETLSYPVASTGRSALKVDTAWDALGRLTSITDEAHDQTAAETVASFTYAGATRLVQIDHSDTSRWEAPATVGSGGGWDGAGRRTLGRVRRLSGTPDTLFSEKLTYDADDEVTRVVWDHVQDSIGHEAQSYGAGSN